MPARFSPLNKTFHENRVEYNSAVKKLNLRQISRPTSFENEKLKITKYWRPFLLCLLRVKCMAGCSGYILKSRLILYAAFWVHIYVCVTMSSL